MPTTILLLCDTHGHVKDSTVKPLRWNRVLVNLRFGHIN